MHFEALATNCGFILGTDNGHNSFTLGMNSSMMENMLINKSTSNMNLEKFTGDTIQLNKRSTINISHFSWRRYPNP